MVKENIIMGSLTLKNHSLDSKFLKLKLIKGYQDILMEADPKQNPEKRGLLSAQY
jgi:hypothetical protein